MRRVLAGLDTEYGFSVEGRGARDQVEDAKALVRSYPGERLTLWDDRFESPRSDLRGFRLERLSFDPEDARYDEGRPLAPAAEVRADQVLGNGARFYNDHGHPEYASPECWSLEELLLHDRAGDLVVRAAAENYSAAVGREVRVYKNNTDFHGASYGSHESYLVPRSVKVEELVLGLMPLLVARQVLCGAGKVGAEQGARCDFQMAQRSDFFAEPVNAETLYRRPVFNTRDEPHADAARWMRLHVICGESNMVSTATRTKVALVKAALHLVEIGAAPLWRLSDPVRAVKVVSRSVDDEGRMDLEGASWTTPRAVLEAYIEEFLSATEGSGDPLVAEMRGVLLHAMGLLEARFADQDRFARSVDWAAKRRLVAMYVEAEDASWDDPSLQSLDLEYHRLDGEGGLFHALLESGALDPEPDAATVEARLVAPAEPTRALARSIALRRFPQQVAAASWGTLTFRSGGGDRTVELPPDAEYPDTLERAETVERLIMELERR
jgi:proteasome accessory factor A